MTRNDEFLWILVNFANSNLREIDYVEKAARLSVIGYRLSEKQKPLKADEVIEKENCLSVFYELEWRSVFVL
jgi:hypothetical protein